MPTQVEIPALARVADLLIPGGLSAYLTEQRLQKGTSWRRIALDLRELTNCEIDVTDVTVRAWAIALGLVDKNAA